MNKSEDIVTNVQANVLKSHGRSRVWFHLFQFDMDKDVATRRKWIKDLINDTVLGITSMEKQWQQTRAFKDGESNGNELVCSLWLSQSGLEAIGANDWTPAGEPYFSQGMASNFTLGAFDDPAVEEWEEAYQQDIHMVVMLAAQPNEVLKDSSKLLVERFEEIGQLLNIEKGETIEDGLEPFGYRDNISYTPFFRGNDGEAAEQLIEEDTSYVLDEEGGSYVVFRKLEQDVKKFNDRIGEVADRIGISREYAEAQACGRFKDGTPLLVTDKITNATDPDLEKRIQAFDREETGYGEDAYGEKCPFHAHIRKVNPRLSSEDMEKLNIPKEYIKNWTGKIVRRGIPYKESNRTGLFFVAYQRSIYLQYALIHKRWLNQDYIEYGPSGKTPSGMDPIAGQKRHTPEYLQEWNTKWERGKKRRAIVDFNDIVTMKGGEFFYVPPLNKLRAL